jgi:hypothetical protein
MLLSFFALLICYLGLVAGFFVGKATKEEVKVGKKNLKLLEWILRLTFVVIFFITFDANILIKFTILGAILIIELGFRNNHAWIGMLCGLNPSLLLGSAIFLHGFPEGSLIEGKFLNFVKKTWTFLLFGILALIIRNYFFA